MAEDIASQQIEDLQIRNQISCRYNKRVQSNVKKLYWKNFKYDMLKMYQSQSLCDVTVVAVNLRIPCHRMVLAAGSKYFFTMFNSFMREADRTLDEVPVVGVEPGCLKVIIDFFYTGTIEVNEENAQGLLEAANMLLLDQIQDLVGKFYIDNLTPENCLGLWVLADHLNNNRLSTAAIDYAALHFVKVIANEEFLELDAPKVHLFLSYPDLVAPSEDTICLAGLNWMNKDPELRAPMMIHILSGIHYLDLTIEFIQLHLLAQPALQREQVLMQRFQDVVNILQFNSLLPRWLKLHPPRTSVDAITSIVIVSGLDRQVYSLARGEDDQYGVVSLQRHHFPEIFFGNVTSSVGCDLNNVLYVCGREGQMWCYQTNHQRWSRCADVLDQRQGSGFTSGVNGKLYALGGYTGLSCMYQNMLSSIAEYDTNTNKWDYCSDLQMPVVFCAASFYYDSVYAFGGATTHITHNGFTGIRCCNSIQQFNTVTKSTCTLAATLPIKSTGCGCKSFVVGDMLIFTDTNIILLADMAALTNGLKNVQWITKSRPAQWRRKSLDCFVICGNKIVVIWKNEMYEAPLDQLLDTDRTEVDWRLAGQLPAVMNSKVAAVLKIKKPTNV